MKEVKKDANKEIKPLEKTELNFEWLYQNKPMLFITLLDSIIEAQVEILEMETFDALKVDTRFSKNLFYWNTDKGKIVYNILTNEIFFYGIQKKYQNKIKKLFQDWRNKSYLGKYLDTHQ